MADSDPGRTTSWAPCPATVLVLLLTLLSGCGSGNNNMEQNPPPPPPPPPVSLTKLSTDTFTNGSSQHATEVEPDTFSFGPTIVSAFQVARIFNGGGADIGFATSTDGGDNWTSGFLPGITVFQGAGTFTGVSDAAVAYDAAHGTWLISTLALGTFDQVLVSRSPDGLNWGNPIAVSAPGSPDKNWIVCDNTNTSPFYGHCYVEWDDPSAQAIIKMSTSTDGGLTWGTALNTANNTAGIGGQPVVQPNGTVVVPIESLINTMLSFTSTNGGASWNSAVAISTISDHAQAGGLRSGPLPSAEMDSAGRVYVVWSDCRFRANCAANDLVLSTSDNGLTWTAPARIPIDPTSSGIDHFIPGLGVDPATSGSTAHLTLIYYFYPVSACGSDCQLSLGFVSSTDGGSTWSAPVTLASGMKLTWLPNTFSGTMVADYLSASYVNGKPFAAFAIAHAKSGGMFDQAIYTTTDPLTPAANAQSFSSKGEKPVPNAKSDHGPRRYYDEDGEFPIPPRKSPLRSAKMTAHPKQKLQTVAH